jgi:DNA polymerase-3 subunit alpha
MKYVSLHHHTTYSYADGFGSPDAHFKRAADLGMSAMAVTEHGNVSSQVKASLAGEKYGLKPIYGLEAYTAPIDMRETKNTRKWHLTLLAMNEEGHFNLNQIVSRSWAEGFYRWPTVTGNILKDHHQGLIVLSGCADSMLACNLLGGKGIETGDERRARKVIENFKRLLGDRYYLETQQFPELGRTKQLNEWYEQMSKRYGIPLVATSDCHYPMPEDNGMQRILHAANRGLGTVAAADAGWEYDIRLTLPTSDKMIYERLRATGLSKSGAEQAIASTAEIAARCNVEIPKMDRVRYPIEQEANFREGMSHLDMFKQWLNDGWKYRKLDKLRGKEKQRYMERVRYEMDLMASKDFIDYFLMLSDAVRHTKDAGIPVGPARGSAAASLVCYILRITEIDPLRYPMMMFERFIDPNRHDLPDVDLDFADEQRDYVRQHMIMRYGENRVGNIGTYTRYRGKNSLDDVARVYEIPKFEIDRAKEFLVERSGGDSRFDASLEDTVAQFPVVKEVFDKYPELYTSIELEGNLKGFGVHAAGVVVGADDLNRYCALYTRHDVGVEKKTLSVLSLDKYDGEHLGVLKLDALGLTTMGMIKIALDLIDMPLEELYEIPMDDPKTLAAFKKADVIGIFQFEGRTTRMVCQEVAPENFMELADINALSRPGPLHSGQTGDYIAIKHGRGKIEHLHPFISKLTETTHGQIIYQEQILAICREIGKFPWLHAATIRKVIAQKKGEAAFNVLYEDFMKGATGQGIDERTADMIWKKMVTAGAYAFNIAHCISYAMLAFWCMWLKVHHPIAFYAAQLRKTPVDPKKMKHIAVMRDMSDARYGRDFKVYPPDLNTSSETWERHPNGDGVQAGFLQIKGIGGSYAKAITDAREEMGGFESWGDLIKVRGIGAAKMEMITAFCQKEDPFDLGKLKNGSAAIVKAIRRGQLGSLPLPDTLADDIPYDAKRSRHAILGTVRARNLQDMFENHRSRTGEELDPKEVKDPHLKDSMTLYMEDESGLMTVKVNRWLYPKLKDALWDIKLGHDFVLMRVEKKAFYGKTVHCNQMWVIDPEDD